VKLSVTPSCFGGLQAADAAALAEALAAGSLAAVDGTLDAAVVGAVVAAPPPLEQPTTMTIVATDAAIVLQRMAASSSRIGRRPYRRSPLRPLHGSPAAQRRTSPRDDAPGCEDADRCAASS